MFIVLLENSKIRVEKRRRKERKRIGKPEVVIFEPADNLEISERSHIFFQLFRVIPEFASVENFGADGDHHLTQLFANYAVFDFFRRIAPFDEFCQEFFVRTVEPVFIRRFCVSLRRFLRSFRPCSLEFQLFLFFIRQLSLFLVRRLLLFNITLYRLLRH